MKKEDVLTIAKMICALMDATTNYEVNQIRDENINFLVENPKFYRQIRNARQRINRIERQKRKSWTLAEMN